MSAAGLPRVDWHSSAEQDHTRGCGWARQELRLPVSWYESIEAGSGVGYPISGDATAARVADVLGLDPRPATRDEKIFKRDQLGPFLHEPA